MSRLFIHLHQHYINKISNITSDGVKNFGRDNLSVEFSTATAAANSFLSNSILSLYKYVEFVPTFYTRMDCKRCPRRFFARRICRLVRISLGLCTSVQVIKVRRLNRQCVYESVTTWVPSQSVVVTFHVLTNMDIIFNIFKVIIHTYERKILI